MDIYFLLGSGGHRYLGQLRHEHAPLGMQLLIQVFVRPFTEWEM